jgi:hypothetical protein
VLLGTSALALLLAAFFAAVPAQRNWNAVGTLASAGLLAVPLYRLVHPHLPQLLH